MVTTTIKMGVNTTTDADNLLSVQTAEEEDPAPRISTRMRVVFAIGILTLCFGTALGAFMIRVIQHIKNEQSRHENVTIRDNALLLTSLFGFAALWACGFMCMIQVFHYDSDPSFGWQLKRKMVEYEQRRLERKKQHAEKQRRKEYEARVNVALKFYDAYRDAQVGILVEPPSGNDNIPTTSIV